MRGVNPRFTAHVVSEDGDALVVDIRTEDGPTQECVEVAITQFQHRGGIRLRRRGIPLPLTVV